MRQISDMHQSYLAQILGKHNSHQMQISGIHVFFYISILFISIIRLKSEENKHNSSITKAQILPQDKLKHGENQA